MAGTDGLKTALADRYVIERELGSGGMATVYLARDIKHDREVALKVLRSDLSAVIGTERFLSEVRITAKLDHPHILTLIDSGEAGGILFYVLPYVRGESLRGKLNREKQMSIDEALSITRQVASALDYAHSHGVVHRDIKPENILIHEGEAVLADFGIALAVKEAGGNRLTETGLSLGTPQYMSPEQATGDRALDKRSDIYSLAAVFYEMIAGEPPVTGATAQAMIAKLLTEKPVKLTVVRDSVPPAMDRAVEKALAKTPADRYTSAGDFVRALNTATQEQPAVATKSSSARWIAIAATAVIVLLGGGYWIAKKKPSAPLHTAVTLRDRVQLTTTGTAQIPVISSDGKTIAYVVTDCSAIGCRYGIEMQDLSGGETRRLLDGATAIYGIEISPDRRNVVFMGSLNGKFGLWQISTLGGKPRYLSPSRGGYFAGGDSLLLLRPSRPGKTFWIAVAGTDGAVVDSIEVPGPGDHLTDAAPTPDSKRIFYSLARGEKLIVYSSDRKGQRYDSLTFDRGVTRGMSATSDALWIIVNDFAMNTVGNYRIPFDAATGKFAARGDTVYRGDATAVSVTADGGTFVYDEGVNINEVWKASLDDLLKGKFPESNRVTRSTTTGSLGMSPDGKLLVTGRQNPDGGQTLTAASWEGGAPIQLPGKHGDMGVKDSATVIVADRDGSGLALSAIDVYSKRKSNFLRLDQSAINDADMLPDGRWVWIPYSANEIRIQAPGQTRYASFKGPEWYLQIFRLAIAPGGKRIGYVGWNAPAEDSLGIGFLDLDTGKHTQLWTIFGEDARLRWLDDQTVLMVLYDTPESLSFYRMKVGGKIERLGSIPRPVTGFNVSSDLKRAFLATKEYHRDVYMSKVVR